MRTPSLVTMVQWQKIKSEVCLMFARHGKKSIQTILFYRFLSVTAALLIIVSAIVYLIQYTKMYKNMENDIIRTSSSIGDAIDLQISQMDNICLNVINSTSVKDTFAEWSQNKNTSAYERRQQQNQLNNSLVSIRGIDTSIRQVNLYSMESGGYGVGNYYGRLSKSTADLPWYKGAVEKDGYRFFQADSHPLLSRHSGTETDRFYFSLYRMYFDNYHNPAGFVEVSKYYDELFEEALSPTTSSSIDITVYDEDGRQIYPDTASGGEKHFDNMASFFYGNGFQNIIDQKDYQNPKFTATWGVSDEDLFDKANETFTQLQNEGKPFFSLVFSSSNHDPFEFPDGKIELYEQPKATRNNSAKYADYAIGYFFKLAKQSNYWKDTVFLVIADHDSRAAGASLVPIKHFHIPALILGDHVEPRRDSRLVSQIDMPTTLLSIAGVSGNYPMIGFDLTQDVNPDRAFMQFDQTQALMKGNHDVVIQTPNSKAKGYVYDKEKDTLTEKEVPEEMKKEALAHALLGSYLYKNRLYKGSEEK